MKKNIFWRNIRILRILFCVLFISILTLPFLYFFPSGVAWNHYLLHTQFVPALMSVFAGTAVFFVILLILTLLFGRIYCSFLCPLGILQDVVSRISSVFKSKKKRRFNYSTPHNILRYTILIIVTVSLIAGVSYPLAFLDPYSVYGRIAAGIFNGAAQGINNLISSVFPSSVSYEPFINVSLWTIAVSFSFFCLIIILSAFHGRIYCNTICPVGSFMGLIGKYSMFRMTINEAKCRECGLCGLYCKSKCLDSKNRNIDYSRCVVCFDCAKICTEKAIGYRFSWSKNSSEIIKKPENKGRREALLIIAALGTVLASRKWGKKLHPAINEENKEIPIIPPGSVSINHLKEHCTACQACVAACPSHIIKPALGEHGIDGFMMPVLSYKKQFCNYNCNVCSQVCPNGAILPVSIENKRLTKIGNVKFRAKNCIVIKEEIECGACSEHCPTKAIKMITLKNGLHFPSLKRDLCIGCGGCEYACPASPKAMMIEPLEIHGIAKSFEEYSSNTQA